MKKADSPIASQTAHGTRNASPMPPTSLEQTVNKRATTATTCTLRGVTVSSRSLMALKKPAFRVEMDPADELVEQIRQILFGQQINADRRRQQQQRPFHQFADDDEIQRRRALASAAMEFLRSSVISGF